MTAQDLVFPGDEIGIAEEFLPGDGAYEEDGRVYADRIGSVEHDTEEFTVEVTPRTSVPVVLEPGDVVVGKVKGIRKSMVIVEAESCVTKDPHRAISGETNATLHISNVADFYVEELEDVFQVGDIIRTGVIKSDPALDVTTKHDFFGVLKRYCPRCRTPMERKGKGLKCPDPECEWKARGKLSQDYGEGQLVPE